jgi:hypothetical protein
MAGLEVVKLKALIMEKDRTILYLEQRVMELEEAEDQELCEEPVQKDEGKKTYPVALRRLVYDCIVNQVATRNV